MHTFSSTRYEKMSYRRCGRSGLLLPEISLGAWQALGSYRDDVAARDIFYTAFDNGITHFDFANNYGTPAGASEELFGHILKDMPRDDLVISSKAGYRMNDGPYGEWGSRKYIISSCNASLKRMGVEYVDVFYSHRFDPDTPLEETLGALHALVQQGKALYIGLSSYPEPYLTQACAFMRENGLAPITLYQPIYNLFNRNIEEDQLPAAHAAGAGVVTFSPLAQGLLTDRYKNGIPSDSRAAQQGNLGSWMRGMITEEALAKVAQFREIAESRGQSISQMALAWQLRCSEITSVICGASSQKQLLENIGSINNTEFTEEELSQIDAICNM